jgi:acyl carrier protein
MELFTHGLRWNLLRAIESGEVKPQDDLGAAGDKLTEIFRCDSLDLVELVMRIEEQKHSRAKTVGDLIALLGPLENDTSDNVSFKAPRK